LTGCMTDYHRMPVGIGLFSVSLFNWKGAKYRLKLLDLSDNQLTMLSPSLRHLANLKNLHLYGNPLPLPAEILGRERNPGNAQVILDAYFQASRPLREAKLLLVGEGNVGKTAIINRLLHNRFSETRSKTVGVDIHQWRVNSENLTVESEQLAGADVLESEQLPIRVNVWDFGGQEIYHATHQFFLTNRSLYLLVLDATQDEAANRLNYWLRHIQSFAGEAPILLVVNKTDLHRLALDERSLRLKYPAIRAVLHVSCKSGDGLSALRQAIEEALAALPHVNDWIPVTWFAVKETLAATGKDFLPYENYEELCEAEGITHEAAQQTLARFLHDLGAALHFHDDRRLAGTHVLNPEWVTGGIYAILNEPTLQDSGILRLYELDKILDRRRYPAHKHTFLLEIMGKFELAVSLGDGQRYLIPGLLPKERPAFDWPTDAQVALEYRYAILPAAILSRLIARLHHHTWQPENGQPVRWRNGLGVTRDGCRALIVADLEAARLTIALDGPAPHRRHLLAVIRAQLDEIHTSFAKLEAKLFVPIPGHPSDKAIAYEDLLYYESEQDWTPRYAPIKERINVRVLLDGIEPPADREQLDIRREFRNLRHQLSETEQRILTGQETLRHAILARLDAQETRVVGAILEKLDANQLALVDLLLDAADQQQIAQWEAENLTRLAQQAVLDLTRLRQNQPDVDQWQSILALLEGDTSWEQKLKFSLPLFPFLSFESEVKVDVRNALKEGWQRLVKQVKAAKRS
jgi:internalin A